MPSAVHHDTVIRGVTQGKGQLFFFFIRFSSYPTFHWNSWTWFDILSIQLFRIPSQISQFWEHISCNQNQQNVQKRHAASKNTEGAGGRWRTGKVEDVFITFQYHLLVVKESNKMRLYNRHLCTVLLPTGGNAWQFNPLVYFSLFHQLHASCGGARQRTSHFASFFDYFYFQLAPTEHWNRIRYLRNVGHLLGFGRHGN